MLAETPIDKACWFGLKFAVGLFRASMSFGKLQSSTGNLWHFGMLDRQRKQFIQDFNLYRVPADLESLLRSLIGILGEGTIPLS